MSKNEPSIRSTATRTLTSLTTKSVTPSSFKAPVRSSASSLPESHSNSPQTSERHSTHQRFVLADPVAFRYLEEDPSTHVLTRREKLAGYECYLVEQWACSRTHPTFIITAYTGDPSHSIVVNVLSVPTNEESWSPRLKVYFKALDQYHARRKETPLGALMITNLSGFPSSLTVIVVPDGDVKTHREAFFVNENLKRLGCSGRVGLTMSKPSGATIAKFYQLYRTSDKIPLGASVIELVKLCQTALVLFDKLEPEYADGLLCDVTEKAINDWWVEFGTEYYNMEPHDGILGPTTVAALLGLLTGARNRLHAYNAPIGKDVFDIDATKRSISHFQRSQHIPKSRRLDRQTLSRLHRATAKAASGEGWLVPRAVKSKVAELSGTGTEMMMGMTGGREKASIADVETVDIDQFVELIHGARSKWLWQGKPRKAPTGEMFNRLSAEDGLIFQSNEQGGFEWSGSRNVCGDSPKGLSRTVTTETQGKRDGDDRNRLSKRPLDRTQSFRQHDPSRGFGRLKDAMKGHDSRHPKDDYEKGGGEPWKDEADAPARHSSDGASESKRYEETSGNYPTPDSTSQLSRNPIFKGTLSTTRTESPGRFSPVVEPPSDDDEQKGLGEAIQFDNEMDDRSMTVSVAGSTYGGVELDEILPGNELPERNVGLLLRRRNSYSRYEHTQSPSRNQAFWPRHCSFSIAEDSIFQWESISLSIEDKLGSAPDMNTLARLEWISAQDAQRTRDKLFDLETLLSPWVASGVKAIQGLDDLIDLDQEELNNLYYPRLEEYQSLRGHSQHMLESERFQLDESVREIEVLGAKLEYEINALRSKVEDVEDGVTEFERQVVSVEERVKELEYDMRDKESWLHWFVRISFGVGQVPETTETVETTEKAVAVQ